MSDPFEAIVERDKRSAETWFKQPALGGCGRTYIDRRWLIAEVTRLREDVARYENSRRIQANENDRLRRCVLQAEDAAKDLVGVIATISGARPPKEASNHVPREHTWITHDEDCPRPGVCSICDGGLALCKICGCGEGSLPTECPGHRVLGVLESAIYDGLIDFKNGSWIPASSIHSPAHYRQGPSPK